MPRVGPVLQCRSDRVSDLACLSTRFPARLVLQYLRDRPAPFISPASARDSQHGWYCSTSGIGPLPSSRLPQHEIPSKDGTAVPPGTARSLRGRSDSAVRFMARVVGLIPGQPGSAGIGTFPSMAPPGSARSLRGRSDPAVRFMARVRISLQPCLSARFRARFPARLVQ